MAPRGGAAPLFCGRVCGTRPPSNDVVLGPMQRHDTRVIARAFKRCPTCCRVGDKLPAAAFYANAARADGLSSQCRKCHTGVQRRYYDRNADSERLRTQHRVKGVRQETRERVLRYLRAHPCVDCGERDPVVLQFHHVRGRKRDNVGSLVAGSYNWGTVAEEIAKCVVLCANCHWRRTAATRGDYRSRHAVDRFGQGGEVE